MMNRKAYSGVTDLDDFENVMYKVEGEDLYVIATAEHPLVSMHANEVFEVKSLPVKYCGFSTNFRKEVGAHGITDRGIWRVHQFNKIEMIILSHPDDSWKHHEFLAKIVEEFFSSLEVPFRKVNVCTGDIGSVAAKKYDYEAWIPSAGAFKEIASCSNCTDYQANRLGIRYRTNEGNKALHTLNSTCVATTRAAVAILENMQQEDGSVQIPKVLRKYMGGLKAIKPPKKPKPKKPTKNSGRSVKRKK
jgi:seryl-tRNA synthetase